MIYIIIVELYVHRVGVVQCWLLSLQTGFNFWEKQQLSCSLLKQGLIAKDGRYQNFDVDAISICKASIYQYITIFITVWTFSLNLCKCIKYTAFCFKFLCFGDLNLPLLLKTATLWTLLLPWLTSNPKIYLFAIYIF